MSPLFRFTGAVGVALALGGAALGAPVRSDAQVLQAAPTHESREVVSARVAEQLGVKLSPSQREQLDVGASLNGTLVDPSRLASFGLADCHPGARVTIARAGPDRLRVEIDELDPVPLTRKITFRIDAKGELSVVPAQ
jgi:hypothetical protein